MAAPARILVVDDEPLIVQVCLTALTQAGYQVQGASGGQEALDWLARERFDLLLVDILMPDMDGLTVLRRARELDPHLTAVVITGHGTPDNVIRALRAGAQDLILKPFDIPDLLATVSQNLARRRREQENLLLRARLPILEVGQALLAQGDIPTLAQRLLEVMVHQFAADRASLMLLDEETNVLYIAGAIGLPAEVVATTRVPMGQGIAGQVLRQKQPLLLDDEADLEPSLRRLLVQPAIAATVCLPLHGREKPLGVINLVRQAGGRSFTPDDLDLLAIMGGQIAIALENASLYKSLQCEVAERKRAEETLRESRQLLERTFASLHDAVFILTASAEIVDCNPAAVKMFGYSCQEMVGRTTDFLHVSPATLEEFRGYLYPAVKEKGFLYLPEFRMRRKDGTIFPTEHRVQPLEDERGRCIGWVSLVRDITERKQTEAALRASEERYRSLFERVPVGLYRTTPAGRLLDANPALMQMLGYPDRESLLAANVIEGYVDPADRQRFQAQIEREGLVRDFETRWRRHDGKAIWVRDSARLVRDPEGQVLYYDGAVEDITERKRVEEALQELFDDLDALVAERTAALARANEELRVLNQATQAFTSTLDLDLVLATVLEETRRLLGVAACSIWLLDEATAELVCWQVTGPHSEHVRGWRLAPGQGIVGWVARRGESLIVADTRTDERHFKSIDRQIGQETRSIICVPLRVKERVIGVLEAVDAGVNRFQPSDLTLLESLAASAAIAIENARLFQEVRLGHERLQRLSRRLVDIQEAERHHIARELHDEIGQLLTGLKLILDMSHHQPTASLDEALALVNELMTRVRDMSLDLRPAMLDDLGLLPALLWLFERYTAQTNVQVDFRHTGLEGQRFAPAVETAAYRIVQEALTNVARHAGVSKVTVRAWADADALNVQVEDRGAGFDPALVAERATTSGLAGMRERATLLGGDLMIESVPGQGTLVMARLPADASP